jgi:hypothetical protein
MITNKIKLDIIKAKNTNAVLLIMVITRTLKIIEVRVENVSLMLLVCFGKISPIDKEILNKVILNKTITMFSISTTQVKIIGIASTIFVTWINVNSLRIEILYLIKVCRNL